MKNVQINKFNSIIILMVLFSLGLRLFYIEKQPYWGDEAYTTWFTSQSYYDLLFWIPTFESHPPFYYSIVKIWNETIGQFLNSSERYFSLFISILLFYTTYKISDHLNADENKKISNISIILFVGFSSIINWYSIEARPYILFMFSFSIALYGFFLIITDNGLNSTKPWLIFSLGALLTNWCHSTGPIHSFIVYAALAHHYFVNRNNTFIRYYIYSIISVFILSIPLIYILVHQVRSWSAGSWIPEPSYNYLLDIFRYLYLLPEQQLSPVFTDGHATYLSNRYRLIVPTLFIFGLYSTFKEKKYNHLYLILFSFSVPIINYVISKFGPNILLDRTLTPAIIPYYLFLSISMTRISYVRIKYLLLIILFIQLSYGTYSKFKHSEKEPWDKITNLISEISGKNDLVILFPCDLKLSLTKAGNESIRHLKIASIPYEYPAIGKGSFYPDGTPAVPGFSTNELPILDRLINENVNKLILVERDESLYDPDNLIHIELAHANRKLISTHKFSGITISEYIN